MSEKEEKPEGEAPPPKKKKMSGKKLVMFIILPILLLGGGGGAAYFLLFKGDEHAAEGGEGEGAAEAEAEPIYFEMPKLTVNLTQTGKKGNFLNLTVWLQLTTPEDPPKMEGVLPRVVDQFQTYLRSLRLEDLQGAEGVQRMRDELLMRAKTAAKPVDVKDVLIKEMLAQ